jgi:lipoate-protein ligase A
MALDETLLLLCGKKISPPTIRFYTWEPFALSIGYSQNPLKELDTDLCNSLNIPVIRRITGGKALMHHNDLSYSVIFHYDGALQRHSILESQRVINNCLVDALRKIGIDARLRLNEENHCDSLSTVSAEKHPFCFLIPAGNDIIAFGQKIVGSAQRRMKNAFIQHGSIFVDQPDDIEARLLAGSGKKTKRVYAPELESSTGISDRKYHHAGYTWINRHLLKKTTIQEIQDVVVKNFEEGLGGKVYRENLTRSEIEIKEKLKEEKYMKDEWNLFRSKSLARRSETLLTG